MRFIISLYILTSIVATSCRKNDLATDSRDLQLSSDTVWFDTVFTKDPGTNYPLSVTKIFYVKNPKKGTIKVDFLLSGGSSSPYRINVDGNAGTDIRGVEIPGKDSIFVFVQCTLEANNQLQPALVLDSLITNVNGNRQKVMLAAWGWDAHYFQKYELNCGEEWSDKTKPYVIVDYAYVKPGCVFTIKEGVKVYNSARSVLFVEGSLHIEGTASERVIFRGDRLGVLYDNQPDQWGGIYLSVGSTDNQVNFADIHNASVGIRVDSLPVSGNYNLVLQNTSLMYCGQAALAGVTAHISATNCLFAQSGSYSFVGLLGGDYQFIHCTFAGYASFSARQDGSFALTNTLRDANGFILRTEPLNCETYNSIIYGIKEEELLIDNGGSAAFTASFNNNIIASKSKPFSGNMYNQDPLFKNTLSGDFGISQFSPAVDKGSILVPPVLTDISGKNRDTKPDIGCYEYIP